MWSPVSHTITPATNLPSSGKWVQKFDKFFKISIFKKTTYFVVAEYKYVKHGPKKFRFYEEKLANALNFANWAKPKFFSFFFRPTLNHVCDCFSNFSIQVWSKKSCLTKKIQVQVFWFVLHLGLSSTIIVSRRC